MHVELLCPLAFLIQKRWNLLATTKPNPHPSKWHTGRSKTELNACGICDSSDVPTYNMQHTIRKDTYIILFAKCLGEFVQAKAGYKGNYFK